MLLAATVAALAAIVGALAGFLRNTSRVAKVVYYLFHLKQAAEGVLNRHAIHEINNLRNPPESPWNRDLFPPVRTGFNWMTTSALLERWAGSRTE